MDWRMESCKEPRGVSIISSVGDSGKSSPDLTGLLELASSVASLEWLRFFLGSFVWSDFVHRQTRPRCHC